MSRTKIWVEEASGWASGSFILAILSQSKAVWLGMAFVEESSQETTFGAFLTSILPQKLTKKWTVWNVEQVWGCSIYMKVPDVEPGGLEEARIQLQILWSICRGFVHWKGRKHEINNNTQFFALQCFTALFCTKRADCPWPNVCLL